MLLSTALRIHPKDVVTLVGGGGKTTAMFRLAGELQAMDRRVVTTMTTKIFVEQMARAPARLILEGEGALLAQLGGALADHGHVLIAGGTIVEQEKVQGVPPELLNRIAAHPAVDVVIVEADGSRRLPFKAPAAHEPVIPSSATIVAPMIGLDVLGQPLNAEHVHRPTLVAELTGAALGDPVTPEMMAAVLAHRDGGAKGLPPRGRLVPILNKVTVARLPAARQIARLLLAQPHVDSVLIAAVTEPDPVREVWGRVGAVVLAAGEAKRFGALKQVVPWRGVPLVAHVTAQALACPDISTVAVTVGAGAEQVTDALAKLSTSPALQLVSVPDWDAGQSCSVRAGLQAVLTPLPPSPDLLAQEREKMTANVGGEARLSAILFLLSDQPGVSPDLLSALIQRHRETLAPVVAPRFQGQRGNPVLFDAVTFPEFAQLDGDIGARPIIQRHRDGIAWVDWPTPEILQDIDTPEAYHASHLTT